MAIYQQVLNDPEATRAALARAHHRLALCYLKKGERSAAIQELRNLVTRYPGEAALVADARRLLDEVALPDPASLMPPDILIYVEMGSPGRQVETILKMLEGTPLAGQLRAAGGLGAEGVAQPAQAVPPQPGDFFGAIFNASTIQELKKVRGWATGIQGVDARGVPAGQHAGQPRYVSVLYLGESDALKGLALMGLRMAGRPAQPIEGMETVLFNEPKMGACAYDASAIIAASTMETLTWCVKQYKGMGAEPTLASANTAFAVADRQSRQESALTLWVDGARLMPTVGSALTGTLPGQHLQMLDGMVNFAALDGAVLRCVVDERNPFVEGAVRVKEGLQSPAVEMARTSPISGSGLAAVPQDAAAVAAFAPGTVSMSPNMFVASVLARLSGLGIVPELLTEVEEVTLFFLPPKELADASRADWANLARLGVGLVITGRNAGQMRVALEQALATVGGQAGQASAPQQVGDLWHYQLSGPQGEPVHLYLAEEGKLMVAALAPGVAQASLEAVRSGRSATSGGPLMAHLNRLDKDTGKVLVANVGRLVELALLVERGRGEVPEELAGALADLAQALADTNVQLHTVELPTSYTVRLGVHGLPPAAKLFPPIARISQYRSHAVPVPEPEPVGIIYSPDGVKVDGDLGEWASIAPLPMLESQLPIAPFKLCWREDGLYGAISTLDSFIQVNLEQPWANDGLQVFVDPQYGRTVEQTPNCFQVTLLPLPDQGPGGALVDVAYTAAGRSAKDIGREPESGIECSWRRTEVGYVLEFHIPASTLAPAAMEAGTKLGVMMLLRDGSTAPVAWFAAGTGADAWQRPDKWGSVQLVK